MVELKKEKNYVRNVAAKIKTKEGEFEISLEANHDIYIGFCYPHENDMPDEIKFEISNENDYLYECINKLYEAFTSNNPNIDGKVVSKNTLTYLINKLSNPYNNKKLTWLSDDFNDEEASKLVIEKIDETNSYVFTFTRSKSKTQTNTYFVRISSVNSRYNNFSMPFIDLYFNLIQYEKNKEYKRVRYNKLENK